MKRKGENETFKLIFNLGMILFVIATGTITYLWINQTISYDRMYQLTSISGYVLMIYFIISFLNYDKIEKMVKQ